MQILESTSLPKSVTGQTQLAELAVSASSSAFYGNGIETFLDRGRRASTYFSTQVKSTKLFEFIAINVLMLDEAPDSRLLRLLAESSVYAGQLEDAETAVYNIHMKLVEALSIVDLDDLEIEVAIRVECLLMAFHVAAAQKQEEELIKDLFHSPPIFKAKVTPSWIRGRKVETKGNLNSV